MNVVTFIRKEAKELQEINNSTFSLLKSIAATIKLLKTATQIDASNEQTSKEIKEWTDEAHNCIHSFSNNLMRKIEKFGHHGLDPRLIMINTLVPHVDKSIDSMVKFSEDINIILRQKPTA